MSTEDENQGERRSPTDRRGEAERRREEDRRIESDRRSMLAGLGGKIVAAPQTREALRSVPSTGGGANRSLVAPALQHIHPQNQYPVASRVPISPAVKAGNLVYVSGVPGCDAKGRLAVGDFEAQMTQVMENIGGILEAAGTDWSHVMKVNVLLTRREDVAAMNRIYAGYFSEGKYPARTTSIVYSLPDPDFLLEIECVALLA